MASERVLFDSDLIRIGRFVCAPGEPDWETENIISGGTLAVFPSVPVLIHHAGHEPVVADRNVVMYYNQGQRYRRGLLHERGDDAVWVAMKGGLAASLVGEFRPEVAGRPERPFDRPHGPSPARCYLQHGALVRVLEGCSGADALAVEEAAVTLVRALLGADAWARGRRARAVKGDTVCARREVAEEVRRLLAVDPGFSWSLDALVGRVLVSPGHLCRLFREQVGVSIHQYLTQLRLREGAAAVLDGERDLTGLALRLGYSTHSHFTDAFRRAFGVPPRALREWGFMEGLALPAA
jgi:AraC family transcriptional regulator